MPWGNNFENKLEPSVEFKPLFDSVGSELRKRDYNKDVSKAVQGATPNVDKAAIEKKIDDLTKLLRQLESERDSLQKQPAQVPTPEMKQPQKAVGGEFAQLFPVKNQG